MRVRPQGSLSMPQLCLVPPAPYLGLLKERGSLLILDVCNLALLYLETGNQPMIPEGGCVLPKPHWRQAWPTWM